MIDVLSTFDNNYAEHWYTQVLEVLLNTSDEVTFHVIADADTLQTLRIEQLSRSLHRICKDAKFEFDLQDIKDVVRKSGQVIDFDLSKGYTRWINEVAYYRLYAQDAIGSSKCIYMDMDVLVRCDLAELYDLDMHGNEVAMGGNYTRFVNHKYFCSGIIVMDLDLMRKDRCTEKFAEASRTLKLTEHDQTILNKVCTIQELPFEYACSQYRWWCNADEPIVDNPKLVHFISSRKPWSNRKVAIRDLFDEWHMYDDAIHSIMRMYESGVLN